jgi:hypothetical protein
MAQSKQPRIGLVPQSEDATPPRSPERDALALAIENHAAATAALRENEISGKRAEQARFAAVRGVDIATSALESSKATDAEAIAAGTPVGETKLARAALTDAEDLLEATRLAGTKLAEQHADLKNRLGFSEMGLKNAVAAVVRAAPEVASLIAQYDAARRNFHDLHGTLAVLYSANALPRELETAIQNSSVDEMVHRDLPPSAIAGRLAAWIKALSADANAELIA